MAQTIQIANATYPDVPSIVCNKQGGGTAIFADPSGTTAVASDVAQGKLFLDASGVLTTGAASGGGGDSPWTLIESKTVNVSTTSTSAATAVTISCGAEISTASKIVWVHVRDTAGPRLNHFYGTDTFFVNAFKANGSTSTFSSAAVECIRYVSSGYAATSSGYGVWGYSISNAGALVVRKRYNSTYTTTIDGDYKIDVYTLDLPDGLFLFE